MSIYQEHILEHYHDPTGRGGLTNPTHKSEGYNPSCGDQLCIELIVSEADKPQNQTITQIGFTGEGCAISQAAASMLCEAVANKPLQQLLSMEKDDMLKLLGIELSHARMKCGLLALETAQKALQKPISK